MNFWNKFKKPIIGLSPMDGVTDAPMRYVTAKHGKSDVITTEFISVDGIAYGAKNLFMDFLYHEIERPIVAQVFGIDPDLFYKSAQIVCELGFDGIDINMGCPARTVERRGAGAGLILNPGLAQEIVIATKQGISDWLEKGLNPNINKRTIDELENTKAQNQANGVKLPENKHQIPVSVKTRIGYAENQVSEWVPKLLEVEPASIAIHGRTLKQLYQGNSDSEALAEAGEIIKKYNSSTTNTPINFIANGDVDSPETALELLNKTSADGIYIGRASNGNPWIFQQVRDFLGTGKYEEISFDKKAVTAVEHAKVHYKIKNPESFVQMRKHLAWYLKSSPDVSKLRVELMKSNNPNEVQTLIDNYLQSQK
jgi:tRNA-dihydrouridine synthase B